MLILAITLLPCLSTSAIHAYAYFSSNGSWYYKPNFEVPYWVPYCKIRMTVSIREFNFVMISSHISSILADFLVLVLTLKRAVYVKRHIGVLRTASMQSLSIVDFVVRHGVLYFSVALAMNLLGLVLTVIDYRNAAATFVWITVFASDLPHETTRYLLYFSSQFTIYPHEPVHSRIPRNIFSFVERRWKFLGTRYLRTHIDSNPSRRYRSASAARFTVSRMHGASRVGRKLWQLCQLLSCSMNVTCQTNTLDIFRTTDRYLYKWTRRVSSNAKFL